MISIISATLRAYEEAYKREFGRERKTQISRGLEAGLAEDLVLTKPRNLWQEYLQMTKNYLKYEQEVK